jgi:hypothetical protein
MQIRFLHFLDGKGLVPNRQAIGHPVGQ